MRLESFSQVDAAMSILKEEMSKEIAEILVASIEAKSKSIHIDSDDINE